VLLDAGATTLEEVVGRSGAPRRDVEHLVRLMGDDAVRHGHEIEVVAGAPYAPLALPATPAPREAPLPVAAMEDLLRDAPAAQKSLDHVAATAETVLRRAAWLDDAFELAQSRVLMLGDHDATALAFHVLGIEPRELVVADVDHDVLAFIGTRAECYFADLRIALPAPLHDRFDLVVTDPPYSPEGVGLFAARAVEAIARHDSGRVILAYGFPPASPALGLKTQRALSSLDLVYEAVLPGFNHYAGAQAIGSRSAQYVLRPTRRSKRAAARVAERTLPAIYSHGAQAVESAGETSRRGLDVGELMTRPARRTGHVAVNLAPFHGRCLVHAALAAQADAVDLLVPNETDGVRSAAEQARTRQLLGDVRFERSVDGTPLTLVRVTGRPPLPEPFAPLPDGRRPIDLPLHLLERLSAGRPRP
jgi:hypothetical protein